MSSIGIKIRQLRENHSMTQKDLSERLEVSQPTLHNIESGITQKVDFLLLDKVCRIFEKDLEYFLENNSIVNNNNVQKNNNGQVCYNCEHFTVNNYCPESLLEEIKKLIAATHNSNSFLSNNANLNHNGSKSLQLYHVRF